MVRKNFNAETGRHDIYARITNRTFAALEKGLRPWRQQWDNGDGAARVMKPLQFDGTPYRNINILTLWAEAIDKGYMSPYWMTFNQAHKLGGHVRKDEHHTPSVYFEKKTVRDPDNENEDQEHHFRIAKQYCVFNAEQIAGLPEQYYAKPGPKRPEPERIERAEKFFAATRADIRHAGVRAFYSPKHDFINMPPLEKFWNAEAYYGTLAHETVDWTKGPGRI